MSPTYAVTWDEGNESAAHWGKLELLSSAVRLEGGTAGSGSTVTDVAYDELAEVRIGRTADERLADRPTLVLERRDGGAVRIAGVAQSGVVAELAERLARRLLGGRQPSPVLVIVPLKAGTGERVRELVTAGPPFDPAGVGLERHHVFLTDREAVFVFEASSREAVEGLVQTADVWAAAAAWSDYVAGPARLAEVGYSWTRPAAGQSAVSPLRSDKPR